MFYLLMEYCLSCLAHSWEWNGAGTAPFKPVCSESVIFLRIRIHRSVPLSNRSESGSLFFIDLQETNKQVFFSIFFAYYFLKVHLRHSSKIKVTKKSQNSGNKGFSYCFYLMIEGSGSGSRRPKNIRILIRNNALSLSSRNPSMLRL
jgi:hypothetical protein